MKTQPIPYYSTRALEIRTLPEMRLICIRELSKYVKGFTKESRPDWGSLLTFFALQPTSGRKESTAQPLNLYKTLEGFFREAVYQSSKLLTRGKEESNSVDAVARFILNCAYSDSSPVRKMS